MRVVYTQTMEIWLFWVLAATLLAGISNFAFKVASNLDYSAELFSLYGGLLSLVLIPIVVAYGGTFVGWGITVLMLFVGGAGAINNIAKVLAMRHIDTSIYFPLYKTLTPALAIVAGVVFFNEAFTVAEWMGLLLGLCVPLVLLQWRDFSTQSNLVAGLWLVLLTAVISAGAAAGNKFAVEFTSGMILQLVFIASLGVTIGSILYLLYKKGPQRLYASIEQETSRGLLVWALARSILITGSMWCMLQAFNLGAPLAIANTIQSFYFLIPIILSVWWYKETVGPRRILAIMLCFMTLALFA